MASPSNAPNPFLTENEAKNVPSPVSPSSRPEGEGHSSALEKTPPSEPVVALGPQLEKKTEPFPEPLPSSSKKWRLVVMIMLAALFLLGGAYWWQRGGDEAEGIDGPIITESTPEAELRQPVTEEIPPTLPDSLASYESENFKAGEIVFLGEAQFLLGDEGIAPLTLDGIRGEAFTEKNKQEVKLVITWKTNKLASAEIGYAKGIGQAPTVVVDEDYGYNHSLIVTGLDPASTYLYTVTAKDRFGNAVTSEPYAVFTGARSVSLFDLIAGAIGDVFGWAVK